MDDHSDDIRRPLSPRIEVKHVTLSILWEEYIAAEPGGYRYSRFCELYRAWEGRLSVTMRQSHAASDKLFVDYAGDGVPVVVDRGVASWIAFYNDRRLHQAQGYRTPMAVWRERMQATKAVDMVDNADALTTCPQQLQQTESLAA